MYLKSFTCAIFFLFICFNSFSQCLSSEVEVKIRVHTDNFGSETTWSLTKANDSFIYASGGPYANITAGQLYIQNVCVPENTNIVFRINDIFGDGMCCAYGNGYYEVEMFNYIVASGGQFGFFEETEFKAAMPLQRDFNLMLIEKDDYYGNGNITFKGKIKSLGTDTVTSYTLKYAINNGAAVTHTFDNQSILPFSTFSFLHPIPFEAINGGTYNVKLWVSDINNSPDLNNLNDTLSFKIVVVSQIPTKKILIEQATGAWCGLCPEAHLLINQILQSNPNAIAVSIHNGDAMSFTDGDLINDTYISAYPQALIDRFKFFDVPGINVGNAIWSEKTNQRASHIVPVDVNVSNTYNSSTRTINIIVSATFYADLNETLRFNCYIVEDSLSGNGSGWEQYNAFNNQIGHPLEGLGNPITTYTHRHVLRKILGTPFGTENSLPNSLSNGQTYTKEYTYTLPVGMKEKDVKIIGLVQKYNSDSYQRAILNSSITSLQGFSLVENLSLINECALFPNPSSQLAHISINLNQAKKAHLKIINTMGQEVFVQNYSLNTGDNLLSVDVSNLSNGLYNCLIYIDNTVLSKKMLVN